ncbi:MAG: ferrous iron transport protein A [Herminiimonas sp.]|nr:ferrous iron transport protein A [Herminiimonas sp.]
MTTATATITSEQDEVCNLALLKKGECATVIGFAATDDAEQCAMQNRLLELGFAPGEPVRIVAESFPNRDPMAVRLGNTTFALRRHEAVRIQVVRGHRAVV